MVVGKHVGLALCTVVLMVLVAVLCTTLTSAAAIYNITNSTINQCGNITQSGSYNLSQSFNNTQFSTGASCLFGVIPACLCILNDSVTLNGQGYTINGSGTTSSWIGIYAENKTSIAVGNISVAMFNYGFLFHTVGSSVIQNVTVSNNTVAGIWLQNLTGASLYSITSLNDHQGIVFLNSTSSSIQTVSISNSLSNSLLVRLSSALTIRNVDIFATPTTQYDNGSLGLYSSWGNTFEHFTILNVPSSGIFLNGSESNTFTNVTINGSWGDAIQIISGNATGSNNNLFSKLSIFNTSTSHYDLNISEHVNKTTFVDLLSVANYSIGTSGRADSYGSTFTVRNSTWGDVNFTRAANTTGTNLLTDITLARNSFYISATKFSTNLLIITMLSIATDEEDYEIIRDGSSCSASACYNFTSLDAGTVRFNATGGSGTTYLIDSDEIDSDDETTTTTSSDDVPTSYWSGGIIVKADKELKEYGSLNANLKSRARLRVKVDGASHHIGIISLTSSSAKINVSSITQQTTLNVGGSSKFEVTGDDYYDLTVRLNRIYNNSANITVTYIHESKTVTSTVIKNTSATQTTNVSSGQTNASEVGTDTPKSTGKGTFWIVAVLILLLTILGGSGYFYWVERQRFNNLKNSVRVKSP